MASYRSPEIIASQILRTKPPLLGDVGGGGVPLFLVFTTVKRLNSSSSVTKKKNFIVSATRETALLHAISTAAITHEITQQCRENKIPGCRCVELKNRQPNSGNGDWQWGGCSDNIWFGENVTRSFIDNLEQEDDARRVVNLHNNDLGRKVSVAFHSRPFSSTKVRCALHRKPLCQLGAGLNANLYTYTHTVQPDSACPKTSF